MAMIITEGTGAEPGAYIAPKPEDIEYFGAGEVVAEELRSIRERRGLPGDTVLRTSDLCGLALSGGGIRSASFSLGVMQALAYSGWLERIDYLSTVSGGGYIGSSLTWMLNSNPGTYGLTDETFPFASFPMSAEARDKPERTPVRSLISARGNTTRWSGRMLNYLRQNASYLTPGNGLNFFTLVWIALRGAGMGLLVYGALITLIFLLAHQAGWLELICRWTFFPELLRQNIFLLLAAAGFTLCLLSIPCYSLASFVYRKTEGKAYAIRRRYEQLAGFLLPTLLGLALFGVVPLLHDWLVAKGEAKTARNDRQEHFTIVGTYADSGALALTGTVTPPTLTRTPAAARVGAAATPACPQPVPPEPGTLRADLDRAVTFFAGRLGKAFKALGAGLGTVLVGIMSGFLAFFKTKSIKPGRLPLGLVVGIGVAGLLLGVFLCGYTVAIAAAETAASNPVAAWLVYGVLPVLTLLLALLVNLNHISIHRYYRDRLMETFLPDILFAGGTARPAKSNRANTAPLQAMTAGPYHIINTNVVLVSSDSPKLRGRGGDNFILSPGYCGSYATGWQRTGTYLGGTMTLASAMAISGAALNPSAGCGGEGITRSPVLSVLMGLLNFRLGNWMPNPRHHAGWGGGLRNPNFLRPGLCEVLLRSLLTEKGYFLQLSDGGHFENLALYELVRRKLKLIVACDGGADPKFTFSDLANAMEKVRTDFGALIMINHADLKPLIPKKEDRDDPDEVPCAERGYLVATINYADNSKGTLIYLTTTFFKGASADLYGYRKEHPAFPDEPTGDQFFDEKQFEAYRELGFQTAWQMMTDPSVASRLGPEGLPARG